MSTSVVYISEKLRIFLSKFEDRSLVAKLLLSESIDTNVLIDDHVNYISISNSDPSKISYLTKDRIEKIEKNSGDYWGSSIRFQTKPGSFVSKILKDIPQKEVEIFSNIFLLHSEKNVHKFEIVSGEEIRTWYSW